MPPLAALELFPQFLLGTSTTIEQVGKRDQNGSVQEIRSTHESIFYAVQDDGSYRIKQLLGIVGVEFASRKSPTGSEATKRIADV